MTVQWRMHRLMAMAMPPGVRLFLDGSGSATFGRKIPPDASVPAPSFTDTSCSVSATVRSVCRRMFWCREVLRSRNVSTIAPIIATSRIRPAVWNRKM